MIALIQRVANAKVEVSGKTIGAIDQGLLVLLGVEKGDTKAQLTKLADKIMHYRCFEDDAGKMNQNVQQIGGALLVVSQFTLAADTHKGLRPSFSSAAEPVIAEQMYLDFIDYCSPKITTETGCFGADMQVSLTNDGPVTFHLKS